MRKLKWRWVGSANVLYGGLTKKNASLIAQPDDPDLPVGFDVMKTSSLERNKPYIELGYGVENIFKFFRVDFVHRLSYLDYDSNVKVRKFGVLVGVQVSL
jgi:hypothetical protein